MKVDVIARLVKESMFIRVNNPSLNKNIGKYHLPHVWDASSNKKVDLPSVNKNQNLWQKFKNIIKYNIPHTPSEVGVLVSIIFSHTPEEAMSGGLVKACVPS